MLNNQDPENIPRQPVSTGPVTPEGKEISSRNALKHGSCSVATLILKTESLEDFLALEKRWFQGYNVDPANPANEYEAELIRTAARADWLFERADRNYCHLEAYFFETYPEIVSWDNHHHCALQRFMRYRTANANLVAKHRKAIEDYRKNRAQEALREQTLQHKKAKQLTYQAKVKLEFGWEDAIKKMKRDAICFGYRTPDGKPTGKQ